MGCGEGCVSSNTHPLGAVWCNLGQRLQPRSQSLENSWENTETSRGWGMQPKVNLCPSDAVWTDTTGPCFTYSVDRKCDLVLNASSCVCTGASWLYLCIHPRFTQDWTLVASSEPFLLCECAFYAHCDCKEKSRLYVQYEEENHSEAEETKTGTRWGLNMKTIHCLKQLVSLRVQIGSWYWQHTIQLQPMSCSSCFTWISLPLMKM